MINHQIKTINHHHHLLQPQHPLVNFSIILGPFSESIHYLRIVLEADGEGVMQDILQFPRGFFYLGSQE